MKAKRKIKNKSKQKPKNKLKEIIRLDQTSVMLEEFSRFLEEAERHRTNNLPSRKLVSDIFKLWADATAKDPKIKYQSDIIRGFGSFLID